MRGCQHRPLLISGLRLLELHRQAEERGVIPEASDELHADGQAIVRPVQRHRHRRLPGDVERRGGGDEGEDLASAGRYASDGGD